MIVEKRPAIVEKHISKTKKDNIDINIHIEKKAALEEGFDDILRDYSVVSYSSVLKKESSLKFLANALDNGDSDDTDDVLDNILKLSKKAHRSYTFDENIYGLGFARHHLYEVFGMVFEASDVEVWNGLYTSVRTKTAFSFLTEASSPIDSPTYSPILRTKFEKLPLPKFFDALLETVGRGILDLVRKYEMRVCSLWETHCNLMELRNFSDFTGTFTGSPLYYVVLKCLLNRNVSPFSNELKKNCRSI